MHKLLYLILLLTVSCSQSYEKLTWLDKYKEFPVQQRTVASDEECFIDQFTISKIKDEISQLEKQFTKKVSLDSKWNFHDFNNAETHYIKRYSEIIKLNDEGKTCDSLVCILNTAYGHKEGEEGHRIYHWFLTMGSGISTARNIPRYSDMEEYKDEDFLFTLNELKGLNILSKTMSKKYRDMKVQSLHRFPDGKAPSAGTAGLYWYQWWTNGNKNKGYIYITKQNLNINKNSKLLFGYFNNVIVHEHTHALDFTYGPKTYKNNTVSSQSDWTDLSWKWVEVTNVYERELEDGTTETYEKTEMDWRPDDSKSEGFVRSYQRTSPSEDFADAGAHYIVTPQSLYDVSPKKYDWFKKYYSSVGTTQDDFKTDQIQELTNKVKPQLWEIVKSCLIDNPSGEEKADKVALSTLNFMEEKPKRCLESGIEERIEKEIFFIKKDLYHACHYYKSIGKDIISTVAEKLSPELMGYINKVGDYKEIQQVWSHYREELKSSCDPSHIYLKVRKKDNAHLLYKTELEKCTDKVHAKYSTYGELFENEKVVYVDSYPYSTIEEETLFALSTMMKGFNTELIRGAEEIVDTCRMPKDEKLNTEGMVFGSGVYINAGVLNCINRNFTENLDGLLYEFMDEKYRLNEDVLYYLTEKYTKQYIELINAELIKIHKNESKNNESIFITDRKETFSSYYTNKKVLGDIHKNKADEDFCINNLKNSFQSDIEKNWNTLGWPITISLNELANSVAQMVCPDLKEVAAAEYKKEYIKIQAQVDEFVLNQTKLDHYWTQKLANEDNFSVLCKSNNKKESYQYAQDLIQNQDIYYASKESLGNDILDSLCNKLELTFKSQLSQIQKYSSSYSKSIKRVISEDLNWQVVFNQEEYVKSCMLASQVKVNKEFITSDNELKQFNLVSAGLISKYLAVKTCESMYSSWAQNDLSKLSSLTTNEENLESEVAKLNPSTVWQTYMLKFYKEVVLDISILLEEKFAEHVSECKGKYLYVRFATMKINRKNCINLFFAEADPKHYLSLYRDGKIYHPKIKEAIIQAGQNKIERLNLEVTKHLK